MLRSVVIALLFVTATLPGVAAAPASTPVVGDPMLAHAGFDRQYLTDLKAKFSGNYCQGTPAPKPGEATHLVLNTARNCLERHNHR